MRNRSDLPDAFEAIQKLQDEAALAGREVCIFLDYDGTLTPIVRDPDRAVLGDSMRATLAALRARVPVAILTGRDLAKVKALVGLDGIVYAASHGFDIEGTAATDDNGERALRHQQGTEFLPVLGEAEQELRDGLAEVEGARVERKRFAITVHYREVPAAARERLEAVVDEVARRHDRLRRSPGKKIHELQPAIDWHKGKALLWLLGRMGLAGEDAVVVFIGDDVTDEDAFRTLAQRGSGIGIVVQDEPAPSAARYALPHPEAVESFLARLGRHVGDDR
jgi:trehalose-phosphatase